MTDHTLRNSLLAAAAAVLLMTVFAVLGWRYFEFDRALFTYAQVLIISSGLTVYRLAIWLHRPPTKLLFRRALQMMKSSNDRLTLGKHLLSRTAGYFALNRFVWKRGATRWSVHWPIMAGFATAMAIVVPLIFGWVWFETPEGDFRSYKLMNFGVHLTTISLDGVPAFIVFHGLVWASFPVIIGCTLALWRRMNDRGDQATQSVGNDFMPLLLLLAIAMTGLMMTVSYSFLSGAYHQPLAAIHMTVVCGTLLWLPYSKLFHIPQRSLKLLHMVYEHEAEKTGKANCVRCGDAFASRQQIADLIGIQHELGYRYEIADMTEHYQYVCPRCRRATLVLTQGQRWRMNDPRTDRPANRTRIATSEPESVEASGTACPVVEL